jgi:hypothetical protein
MKKFVGLFACCKRTKKEKETSNANVHTIENDELEEQESLSRDLEFIQNSNVSKLRGGNRLMNSVN